MSNPLKRITAWSRSYPYRIGRRGAFMILIGAMMLVYGIGMVIVPGGAIPAARMVLFSLLPYYVWEILFISTGLFALFEGLLKRRNNNTLSLTLLSTLTATWATGYLVAAVISYSATTSRQGFLSALSWGFMTGVIHIVAGWPDYGPPERHLKE